MNKRYIDFVPVKKGEVDFKGSPFSEKEKKKVTSTELKSKKIRATNKDLLKKQVKREVLPVEKPVEKLAMKPRAVSSPKMDIPKNPFINTNKVTKRPLSKNVYRKEVKTPVEEPKGPVTIITKPEKGAHVSLIVTIILTIVLGAAAGTVAFLLLPK